MQARRSQDRPTRQRISFRNLTCTFELLAKTMTKGTVKLSPIPTRTKKKAMRPRLIVLSARIRRPAPRVQIPNPDQITSPYRLNFEMYKPAHVEEIVWAPTRGN